VVALDEASGEMREGDNVLVAVFGGGLSWGQLWLKRMGQAS
jgi:3-oxoacyl-[acyl-carrier-protein] synthase III